MAVTGIHMTADTAEFSQKPTQNSGNRNDRRQWRETDAIRKRCKK
jgi:hypothetical protein